MGEASLHVIDAEGRRVVALDKPTVVLGRRGGVDLQFASADISRDHADSVCDDGRDILHDRLARGVRDAGGAGH